MSDDVTITVRVNDHTAAGFRDVNGRVRDMQGRFATASGDMQRSSLASSKSLLDLKASLLSLAPAAVPVAASLAPIALQAGAAGLAVGAFGAALKPQLTSLSEVSKAQDKYTESVRKYGAHSSQAVQAQVAAEQSLRSMPAATQRAAVGYQQLREKSTAWSDSLAKFTMAPVEKSFTVLGQLVPKLTPMVKGASTQLDRLMSVAGGAINTSGFDSFSKKVSDFANASLKKATDGAIHFMRVLSEGNARGPMAQFFEYARAQGPAVQQLLSNVAKAAGNLLQGAAQAGPGLLSLVNAMAKLVAAVPPSLIGNLMQVYAAFKLIKLAGAGIGAVSGGIETLAAKITTLRAASAAAGGGLAGLRAAFATLGTATKATLVVAGIAAVVAVFSKLSSMGKSAPPDVDKLTSALTRLGATGEVTGEAAGKFGTHFEKLKDQMNKVLDPSVAESVNNWGHSISGGLLKGGDATEKLTGSFKAIDESLAGMVKGGKAKLAGTALKAMLDTMNPEQAKKLLASIGQYKGALADQGLEAKLTAQSMGLFGDAVQATQAKLDAQKQSADGLRASIVALNDVNRSAYDSQIAFEAGVDSLSEAFKKNGATLNIHTEAGRANGQAMSAAAKAQDEMIASGLAAGDSLSSMTKKSGELRGEMMRLATEAFDGNKKKAQEYVNTLLGTPGEIRTLVKLEREEAVTGLQAVEAAIRKTPGAKTITVDTLNGAAIKALEAVGLKTRQLPDGKTAVYTATGKALGGIAAVARALNALDGKTANTWTRNTVTTVRETIAKYSTIGRPAQGQGGVSKYADGGPITGGSGVEDDVPILAMGGEFMVNKDSARKHRRLLEAINDDRLPKFAKGGSVSKLSQAEKDARGGLRGQFGISSFGRMAGYSRTPFEKGLGAPADLSSLVSSLNELGGQIKAAFHGRAESSLLKQLGSIGKSLINYEKKLNTVTASLDKAKSKLDDLKNSASQLSDSVKGGVLSSANITRGASGGTVTVASIMGGLTASRDKATAFADALKGLKSKGLDKGLIQQIGEAGIEGGGLETAGALLGASSSEISSVNSLQGQIAKAAGAAGKTTADAVYGAALKAQQKLVDSLKGQQAKLEKAMANLAKVMEKALQRAVGKKAAGGIVGAAASGGLRGGLTWVGEHEPELLDLPVGSRVWSGPDSRRMAGGDGGGERRTVVEFRSSGSDVDEFLVTMIRRAVRSRGGDIKFVFAGRRSM
ncbi:phage tail protein [Streptomyces olivochromogenes]|uniref:phage tail protein n=1 Tax=Streptomyces olivochromogenes TaxID=1963 RepID=UPI00369662D3